MAKKSRKKFWLVKRIFQCFFVVVFMTCVIAAVGVYMKYGKEVLSLYADAQKIIDNSKDSDFKASETSLVYDANGDLMKKIWGEKDVYYLDKKDIPDNVKNAFVCIEDKKFYKHNGIDVKRIAGAAVAIMRANAITQGGSTITQQLVKNVYLTNSTRWQRKVEEIFIAVGIEKKYSKDQLLEYYINNIYFQNGYYGIQAAAKGYFRKSASSLTLSESAFLCAIPNNPKLYNPYTNKEAIIKRRDLILQQMNHDGYITDAEYQEALNQKIKVKKPKKTKSNSVDSFVMVQATKALMRQKGFEFQYYFTDKEAQEKYKKEYNALYDECEASLYNGGYRIYTSIDPDKQQALQEAVDQSLAPFTEVGADDKLYELQSSATCIDNKTGRVVAIVGGRSQDDVKEYSLNRAFQSYRQPGSSIKPLIVYTPSLEKGYTPDSIVSDTRINEKDAPKNDNGTYMGRITLRKAVEQSRNVVAWRLFQELTPKVGLSYLKKMHYAKIVNSDYVLAAAVGGFTYGTNTLEQASGYATIANGGKFREPTCIVSITNSDGDIVVSDATPETKVYEKNATLMMVDVMKGVISHGTGHGLALNNRMPCAGKTGTTDNNKDGWFCGFTKYYTTCVWVGYDTPRTMVGLYGATYPGKIWKQYMNIIHEGLPVLDWDPYTNTGTKKNSTEENDVTTEEKTKDKDKKATTEDTQEDTTQATTEAPTATEAPIVTEAPATEPPATEAPATEPPATQAPAATEAAPAESAQ